jgi:hypothetical protein
MVTTREVLRRSSVTTPGDAEVQVFCARSPGCVCAAPSLTQPAQSRRSHADTSREIPRACEDRFESSTRDLTTQPSNLRRELQRLLDV